MCKKCAEKFAAYTANEHQIYGENGQVSALFAKLNAELPSSVAVMINDNLPEDEKTKAREDAKEVDGAVKLAMLLGYAIGSSDMLGEHINIIQQSVQLGINYALDQQGAAEEAAGVPN